MPNKDHSVVRVTMRVGGDAKPQIETELTPEELQAIGLITVQWAHLEHCLLIRTFLIAEEAKIETPKDATNLTFRKRLRAFWDITQFISNRDEKAAIEKLADRIANAEDQRHKITHGMWGWDEINPKKLAAYSFRKPFNYTHPFDLKKLQKLANILGELLFELSFPNGLLDVEPLPFPERFPETLVPLIVNGIEDME